MEPKKFDITQKRELFIPGCLSMREDNAEEVIEGVAIVCDKETVLYEGSDWREIEVIDKNCIREDFVKGQDIKINALHDRSLTFGRTGGNLTIESREDGLAFRCTGTSEKFKETRALIKDGVYTGCSFEFYPKDYTVTEREGADGKTEYVIRHNEFAVIDALTVAMQPAYKQTSVNARELYREQHPDTPAEPTEEELKAKREAEEKAEREKKTREHELQVLQEEVMEDRLFAERENI